MALLALAANVCSEEKKQATEEELLRPPAREEARLEAERITPEKVSGEISAQRAQPEDVPRNIVWNTLPFYLRYGNRFAMMRDADLYSIQFRP